MKQISEYMAKFAPKNDFYNFRGYSPTNTMTNEVYAVYGSFEDWVYGT